MSSVRTPSLFRPSPPLDFFPRVVARLASSTGVVSCLFLVAILGQVVVDVVVRTVSGIPLGGTYELVSQLFMPALAFLALPLAQLKGELVTVTLLTDKLDVRWRQPVLRGIAIVTTVAAAFLTWHVALDAIEAVASSEHTTGSIDLPLWPMKFAAAVSAAILTLTLLISAFNGKSADRSDDAGSDRRDDPDSHSHARDSSRITKVHLLFTVVIIVTGALVLAAPFPREAIGALVIAMTVAMIIAGMPVAFAILIPSLLGLVSLGGWRATESALMNLPIATSASWEYSVIPMFILMGITLWRSGLTDGIFTAARVWLGRLPGGLAIATNFAGAGLASASGSTIGISYALGRMAIPEMLRAGYHPAIATGTVAMAGTLGQLIPPSIVLVVYAGVAQTAIGPQLLAAIVPGLMVALAYAVMLYVRARLRPELAPPSTDRYTAMEKLSVLRHILPIIALVIIIVGGMFSGIFTPTEAGAVAAFVAVVLGVFLGKGRAAKDTWRMLGDSFRDTVTATAVVILLIISIQFLSRAIALSGLPQLITDVLTSLGLGRIAFLILLAIIILVLGMFMDGLAVMLLIVPTLAPALEIMGVDMIWFGVFMVMLVELGLVTPPVGVLVFIVQGLSRNMRTNEGRSIDVATVFRGVAPFIGMSAVILLVIILFPSVTEWLPSISNAE